MSMFGTRPHNPPPGVLPATNEESILPRPQRISLTSKLIKLTQTGHSCADFLCEPSADGREATAVAWLRRKLHEVFGWEPSTAETPRVHVVVGTVESAPPVREWIERSGITPLERPESYSIRVSDDYVALFSQNGEGLLRGVTTLVQLIMGNEDGDLCVPCGHIDDWPTLPLRFFLGWPRVERRPREVVDFAFRNKFNRIFYGLWNWTSGERLTDEDRTLVDYARGLGIELSFQQSRLSFPEDFDATNTDHVNRVIRLYDEAMDTGFRSFGLMFDDQTYQSVEAEMNLTLALYRRLEQRLGNDFEFTFVPEVYWVPGELSGWPPQPERAEEFRLKHIDYLKNMGKALPPSVEIYIANNWNDYPEGYSQVQEREFNALAQRKPIFFENQIVNDYRRSIILPFPLHNRPAEFATAVKGYALNPPMPYAAHYVCMMTGAALAWNPAGYNPPVAWGAALRHWFGEERAFAVLEGLNELNKLFVEWTHPHFPAANHYASLSAKVKARKLTVRLVDAWRERLRALRSTFSEALKKSGTGTDALQYYIEEMDRLDIDMALFNDMLETGEQLLKSSLEERDAVIASYRARQEDRYTKLLSIAARRAPNVGGVQEYLAEKYGPRQALPDRSSNIPAGWWVTYYYGTMKDEIENTLHAGEEFLSSTGTEHTEFKAE